MRGVSLVEIGRQGEEGGGSSEREGGVARGIRTERAATTV